MPVRRIATALVVLNVALAAVTRASASDVDRLIAALLGNTEMASDLQQLTDVIGGRATGSPANEKSIDWALAAFKRAGVDARREPFEMPGRWLEKSATAVVAGGAAFSPRVAAMPFSIATPASGISATLVDGGRGSDGDLKRLGNSIEGAWVLVETPELRTLDDLFARHTTRRAPPKHGCSQPVRPASFI